MLAERILSHTLRAGAALAALVVALIFLFMVQESALTLRELGVWRFISDAGWHPNADATQGQFNLLPMLAGTLLSTAGAIIIATPLGLLSALFCRFYAPPRVTAFYQRLIELLAGIPSVIYGFWGLVVLVPLIGAWQPPGASLLAGILILAVMILPTIALFAEAALEAVPADHARAAAALGMSRGAIITGVLLPAARPGIATGILLAVGRAAGETMAVLMVCGNVVQIPARLSEPMRTLTANIALEMGYALGDHRGALYVTGLVLLVLVTCLVGTAARLQRTHA